MKDLAKLEAAAASWIGTPFCEHSAVKGAGVCCHALPLEIYFEAGWLPRFPMPRMAPGVASLSRVLTWSEGPGAAYFSSVAVAEPGDTLHFQLGRTSHFVLKLRDDLLIHVMSAGVVYAHHLPAHWLQRLRRIWRVNAELSESGGEKPKS